MIKRNAVDARDICFQIIAPAIDNALLIDEVYVENFNDTVIVKTSDGRKFHITVTEE